MSGYVPASGEKDPARLATAIQHLYQGRSHAVGAFTLTPNATSTMVTAPNCSQASVVVLMPRTANAAAHMATISIVPGRGSFAVSHAANPNADCVFGFVALG